jgi:SSS family solute:Na+ symporter
MGTARKEPRVTALDWIIIVAYLLMALGMGLYHMRKATTGIESYFLSGRNTSWWVLGTSIAATSFAADTPLAVSGFVIKSGISWNWWWWGMAMAGLMTVFFFARLWRRSGVTTDVELIEVRYSGKPAKFLRGYVPIHLGVLNNCITMGWVNLAMVKVLTNTIGVNPDHALYFCFGFSLLYTMLAGLKGVMATDVIQFVLAMFGSIYLAVVAVQGVGGLGELHSSLVAVHGAERTSEILAFFPKSTSELFMPVLCFIFFQWWAASNLGGGSYAVQRILSAKNEKHAFLGTLWYNIAQFVLRTWPWIVAGLCAAILYPTLEDPEIGYILLMKKFLPAGILGLAIATFFAAYMSTIDTHLNWGASYLVNDIYKRFIRRSASDKHYIVVSMVATVLLAFTGMMVTTVMKSIREGWYIITSISGGVSIIYVLRWYWWRINAWSEISAMVSALLCTIIFRYVLGISYPNVLFFIVPITVLISLVVTFITRPVDEDTLIEFYRRIRPGGRFWKPVADRIPGLANIDKPAKSIPAYVLSVISIYAALFGVGRLLLGPRWQGVVMLAVCVICAYAVWRLIKRMNWSESGEKSA